MVIRTEVNEVVIEITEGVLSHMVDMALWMAAYWGTMSLPQSSSGQLWRARIEADRFLNEMNYDVIKQAIQNAKARGFIQKSRRHAWPQITEAGKRKLAAALPRYDGERVWDGRLHLITYDIPEVKRRDRALLREYLKRIGCGMLQESVWLTPYNPIDTVRSFIEDHNLGGTIIISDLGKDGSIGEEDVSSLVTRIYNLADLNNAYKAFLKENKGKPVDHWMVLRFFSILRRDPQLPFTLLPDWWKGTEAYHKIRDSLKTIISTTDRMAK